MKTFAARFKLKPCPFCGGADLNRVILILAVKPNPMKVKCNGCGFESTSFQSGIDAAAIEWNGIKQLH